MTRVSRALEREWNLEERLEPEGHFPTAGVLPHRERGVLELDVGVLRLSRVERAELHHVELERPVAQTAHADVANPPESPEDFPPGLELQFE